MTAPAHADVRSFMATCMADVADFRQLPATLARAGYHEVDPALGTPGASVVASAPGRRVWMAGGHGGAAPEAYTGFAPAGPGVPLEICWHVSRPSETAADALSILQVAYPPIATPASGTVDFYGGSEQWAARAGPTNVLLRVDWAARDHPEQSGGYLYVVKPTR